MSGMNPTLSAEIASAAARLVVDEGMEYGPAKRKAARVLGSRATRPGELPDNTQVEDEVRVYLELFHADTQPAELRALRLVAAEWMERLEEFRPYLTGAVWRGTATRLNNVHLQLYCDDPKQAEIALIEKHVDYEVATSTDPRGRPVDMLVVASPSRELGEHVTVMLTILDHDDLRGALKRDERGMAVRGNLAALKKLLESSS